MMWLTEMHVGKAIPRSRFLLFLLAKVFLTSSSIIASTVLQIVAISAPGTASSLAFARHTIVWDVVLDKGDPLLSLARLTVGDDGGCLVLVENGRLVNERLLFFLLVVFFGTGVSFNHPTDSLFLLT